MLNIVDVNQLDDKDVEPQKNVDFDPIPFLLLNKGKPCIVWTIMSDWFK